MDELVLLLGLKVLLGEILGVPVPEVLSICLVPPFSGFIPEDSIVTTTRGQRSAWFQACLPQIRTKMIGDVRRRAHRSTDLGSSVEYHAVQVADSGLVLDK